MPINFSHSHLALTWWDMHRSSRRQFCRWPVSLYLCLEWLTVHTLRSTWPSMKFFKYTYNHPHLKIWLPALSIERFTSTYSLKVKGRNHSVHTHSTTQKHRKNFMKFDTGESYYNVSSFQHKFRPDNFNDHFTWTPTSVYLNIFSIPDKYSSKQTNHN
jgi:hypothetical protein